MTDLYLAQCLYGDAAQAQTADTLLSIIPAIVPLLPELVPRIVDFTIGQATQDGFNFTPMSAQPGPHHLLQIFRIERLPNGSVGIRSFFGNYWRSAGWGRVVSQAPHCLGNETWTLRESRTQYESDEESQEESDEESQEESDEESDEE